MGLHSMRAMESEARSDSGVELAFEDSIDLELFYDGAGRGEILAQLLDAVAAPAPLMVLSGGEGCGKTAMCRMLERRCSEALRVVFFATTVESFEDVVRTLAASLSLQIGPSEEGRGMDGAVDQIVARLAEDGTGLLLIFDQAEDIYLATLERIRKMLDRVTAAGVRLQILFSGRKTFLENCEQLAICDFRTNEGVHFDLPPLDEQQTAAYLRSIAAKTLPAEKARVFNDEVARSIHGLSKGVPRRINLLAQESLRSQGNDISFMTLLDTVQEDLAGEKSARRPRRRLADKRSWSWWVGGAGVLLLSFLLFRPGQETQVSHQATASQSLQKETGQVEKVDKGGEGSGQPEEATAQVSPPEPLDAASPPSTEPVPAREQGKSTVIQDAAMIAATPSQETKAGELSGSGNAANNEPASPVAAAADAPKLPGAVEIEVSQAREAAGATTGEVAVVSEASAKAVVADAALEDRAARKGEKVIAPSDFKIPVLRQNPPKKVRPASWSDKDVDAAKAATKGEGADATATLTVDQLYQKRLQAGSAWLGRQKTEKFTVQLMVLTAKTAEANFKKLLGQAPYRQEAGNFFIFKKNGSPEVVWVFYGEYPSMELARVGQSSLPAFLREHQPYAIAVKGALAKVQGK